MYEQIPALASLRGPATQLPGTSAGRNTDNGNQDAGSQHRTADQNGAAVINHNVDLQFTGNTAFAKRVRKGDITAKRQELMNLPDEPIMCPVAALGKERCLKWHLKGHCIQNCSRAYDHEELEGTAKEEMYDYARAMFK